MGIVPPGSAGDGEGEDEPGRLGHDGRPGRSPVSPPPLGYLKWAHPSGARL